VIKLALVVGIMATVATAAAAMIPFRASAPHSFSIRGSVNGLTPGAKTSLRVRIRNPYRRRIRVVSVRAFVKPSGHPCPVVNIRVKPFRGSLLIGARSSRSLSLEVSMSRSAGLACQGAIFPLRFSGRAIGA